MLGSFPFNGNLTADPKFTPAEGDRKARLNFSVASTTNRGRDNESTEFYDMTAFGSNAENGHKTLKKGSAVNGEARVRSYKRTFTIKGEDKEINQVGITATRLGADLMFATAAITKNPSKGSRDDFDPDEAPAEKPAAKTAAKKPAPAKEAPAAASDDDDDEF